MDAIEKMAQVFSDQVNLEICTLQHAMTVVDNSYSYKHALVTFRKFGVDTKGMEGKLHSLQHELSQLRLYLELEGDIKAMAYKALLVNFYDDERYLAFNQEVCFSYACKFLCSMGPKRAHFSNAAYITAADIQRAEIKLAMTSPNLYVGPDLYCYEMLT